MHADIYRTVRQWVDTGDAGVDRCGARLRRNFERQDVKSLRGQAGLARQVIHALAGC